VTSPRLMVGEKRGAVEDGTVPWGAVTGCCVSKEVLCCQGFHAGGREGGGTKGKDIGAWRFARGLTHCLEGATPQSSMNL
jgi:hypothetical protein